MIPKMRIIFDKRSKIASIWTSDGCIASLRCNKIRRNGLCTEIVYRRTAIMATYNDVEIEKVE